MAVNTPEWNLKQVPIDISPSFFTRTGKTYSLTESDKEEIAEIVERSYSMDGYIKQTDYATTTTGGSVKVMWTPIADEASIQTYGERVNTMMQAAIYEDTEISEHDQVEINGARFEIVSIRQYPSYRLAQVQKI